jgi:hypothetical protein
MRRTVVRRTVAAAAVPTLVAAVLTGCGSGSGDSGNASDSSDVSQASYGRYTAGQEVDKAAFVQDLLKGLQKATTSRVTVSIDHGSGDPITAEGQIDLTADPVDAAISVTLPQASTPFDLRLVDGVAYANLGPLTNGKYATFDLGDSKNLPPQVQGLLDQMDPVKAFQKFGPSLSSVTYVGDEQVDGTTTRHFTLVVDTSKIAEMKDVPESADIPQQVSIEAWFDDDFLVRKVEAATDGAEQIQVQATFSDWGQPVDISAPPAGQVAEGSHSMGLGWSAATTRG